MNGGLNCNQLKCWMCLCSLLSKKKKEPDLLQLYPPSLQLKDAFVESSFTLFLSVSNMFHLCWTFRFSNLQSLKCFTFCQPYNELVCTSFWRRQFMSSNACLDRCFSISRRSDRGWHTQGQSLGTKGKKPKTACGVNVTFSLCKSQLELRRVVCELLLELKQLLLLWFRPVFQLLHLTQIGTVQYWCGATEWGQFQMDQTFYFVTELDVELRQILYLSEEFPFPQ